jgi:large subunit ribosomal protein L25
MMVTVTEDKILNGEKRSETGTSASRRFRKQGQIPAVIYGKNDPVHITINSAEFNSKIKHVSESGLLTIKLGRSKHDVLIKDFQDNPLKREIYHIDFFEVTQGEKLHMTVPVILQNAGAAPGVRLGGMLEQIMHEVEIECLPKDIPEHLYCDVSSLNLNESIPVGGLVVPQGIKLISDLDQTVVTITSHKEEVPEGEGEEEEVVVLTEKKAGESGE